MDQGSYLSRALWQYRHHSLYTDLTIVTSDGSLPTHAAMLAGLFTSFGITFPTREEVAECLFLPDLTMAQVEDALKMVYMGHKHDVLTSKLKNLNSLIKMELSDYVEQTEPKVVVDDEKDDFLEDYHHDDNNDYDYEDLKSEAKTSLLEKQSKNFVKKSKSDKNTLFECKKCGDECYGKKDYATHMKEHHGKKLKLEKTSDKWEEASGCSYCGKEIKKNHFRQHLALLHREEVIQNHPDIEFNMPCQECDMKFLGVQDLDKHSNNVHDKSTREWKCHICSLKLNSKPLLAKHKKEQHPEDLLAKQHQCPHCERTCSIESVLKTHIYNVHKDKRSLHPELTPNHACETCGEEFYDRASMRRHVLINHTDNCYCKLCSRYFSDDVALQKHQDSEHNSTTHICDICSKDFPSKQRLKAHIKRHEGSWRDKFRFACSQCTQGRYQTEEKLQEHMLNDHSGKEYICSQCPTVFATNAARSIHEKRNHTEKTIKCDHCEMMFSLQCHKNSHIRMVHIKKKDKICPHCGEGFSDKDTFEAHVNRHLDYRPHSCDMCGKTFLIERDLNTHMKTHTLPYQCDQCEVRVGSSEQLKDHIRRVHEGVQLECRFSCGWQGWDRRNLARHEAACKSNPIPNAPYSIAKGTANRLTLENFHSKLEKNEKKFKPYQPKFL